MKKIVHVSINSCEHERRIFNEAVSARSANYAVEILGLRVGGVPWRGRYSGVPIRRLTLLFWKGGPIKFLTFNIKLLVRLLHYRFDILHAHDLWVLPAAALAARLRRRPLIYDAHEFYRGLNIFRTKKLSGRIWAFAEELFIGNVQCLICVNSYQAKLYSQLYPDLKRIRVLHNFPSEKDFVAAESMKRFPERRNEVIFQGMLKPGRGIFPLLNAIAKISEVQLTLVGYGELHGALDKEIRQKGLRDRVSLKGKRPLSEMLNYAANARAGAVLFEPQSENYRYASPNKFFEYVAAGTPVIASDIPTFREFLETFEVGILVDADNEKAVADAVMRLTGDTACWEKYHANCLRARLEWNWERQERVLLAIYSESGRRT